MATSGTVGLTTIQTQKLVDRGYRLCKVAPQVVTSEMLQTALDELYLMLSSLANTGVPLWCIQKYILPLYYGQQSVTTPVGTVSVLQGVIRDLTRFTGTSFSSAADSGLSFDGDITTSCVTAAAGNIGLQLENQLAVTTVGILASATGAWSIVLEYSDDGVTYTPFYTNTAYAAVSGEWQWFDFEELPQAYYWRLRGVGATALSVAELVFANNPSEILMAPINKDDYFNLPNKAFTGRPVQYWQDRQIPPNMKIWPAADAPSTFRQIVINAHRQIQDVGTLQQSIEMPSRWLDAISQRLGRYLLKVTPEARLTADERQNLIDDAEKAWKEAWAEERDPSPINLAPDISMYTK